MPLLFRYATEQDADSLHELIQAAFAEYRGTIPVPPGALNETVEDTRKAASEGRVLLAFDFDPAVEDTTVDLKEANLVGTARYDVRDGYLYVGRVAVHPDRRGQGIGAALMHNLERLAPKLDRTRIRLAT